jgi:U32 family peptidase
MTAVKPKRNSKKEKKPELLAPAGGIDTFFAALEQGADAVYVGTPQFNARLKAKNFSFEELGRMIQYAHSIKRKVYITLNTIVKEAELPDLVDTLCRIREISPDALIVQEFGVYRLARKLAPQVPLHASTQMTIHNLDGAIQAQRMGFERAILAREMTLEEITNIRRNCEIELESFIHGAVCYSVSGQCNFSSYAHGKSSNRGQCLQPCRRLYEVDSESKPIFATLDLSAAPIISQVMAAGISCFKIEGRLKPTGTVAQTVAAYRLLIDAYPKITKEVVAEAREHIRLAIGRRQSTGFFLSETPDESMVNNGMTQSGRYLGRAQNTDGCRFDLETQEVVKVGDRLNIQKNQEQAPKKFTVTQLLLGDKYINRSYPSQLVTIVAPFPIDQGSEVVKSIDGDALTKETKKYAEKIWPTATQRSKVRFAAQFAYTDSGSVVLESQVDGRTVRVEQWPSYEKNLPVQNVSAILSADSEAFSIRLRTTVAEEFPDGVPMTDKELFALRERVLSGLAKELDKTRKKALKDLSTPLPTAYTALKEDQEILVRVQTLEECVAQVYGSPAFPVVPIYALADGRLEMFQKDTELMKRLIVQLPAVAFDRENDRETLHGLLRSAVQAGIKGVMVSNIGNFNLLHPHRKRRLTVYADETLHCLNSETVAQLQELGVHSVMFAQEGDSKALSDLAVRAGGENLSVTLYGKVMLFCSRQPSPQSAHQANCVVGPGDGLDIYHRRGLIQVVPEKEFSIRHHLPDLKALGIQRFLYDLSYAPNSSPQLLHRLMAPVPA